MSKFTNSASNYLCAVPRIFIITILLIVFVSVSYSQQSKQLSDADLALCKAKIERAHQGFYKLPYNQTYVRDVIMTAIRNERASVAPHFPTRQAGQSSDQLFESWIESYPAEYEAYLVFLRKQHEKWRIASSSTSANH